MNEKHFRKLLQSADDAQLSRIARLSQIREPADDTSFAEEEIFEVKPAPHINWMLLTSEAAAIAVVGGVAAIGFAMSRNTRPMIEPATLTTQEIPCTAPFYADLAANPVYIGMSDQTLSEEQKQALYSALNQVDWSVYEEAPAYSSTEDNPLLLSIGAQAGVEGADRAVGCITFEQNAHRVIWSKPDDSTQTPVMLKLYTLSDEAYAAVYDAVFGIVETQDVRLNDNYAPFYADLCSSSIISTATRLEESPCGVSATRTHGSMDGLSKVAQTIHCSSIATIRQSLLSTKSSTYLNKHIYETTLSISQ